MSINFGQVVRIAVLAAEAYGEYSGAKGDDKLEKAINIVREIEPKLVDTMVRVTAVIEKIELILSELNDSGWDLLDNLADRVEVFADKARSAVARIRNRFDWLTDLLDDIETDVPIFVDHDR